MLSGSLVVQLKATSVIPRRYDRAALCGNAGSHSESIQCWTFANYSSAFNRWLCKIASIVEAFPAPPSLRIPDGRLHKGRAAAGPSTSVDVIRSGVGPSVVSHVRAPETEPPSSRSSSILRPLRIVRTDTGPRQESTSVP